MMPRFRRRDLLVFPHVTVVILFVDLKVQGVVSKRSVDIRVEQISGAKEQFCSRASIWRSRKSRAR